MSWCAVWGQLAVEESKIQGWIQTQSPHSSTAGSSSFALLVWLGMNGTGLVFFQTSCTLPHYKLHHVLSFPLPYLPVSFKSNTGMQEGCFCWELFWAETTGENDPVSCLVFQTASACGEGMCWERVRENTEKGEKAQKGRGKKYSKEARDKLQVADYFSPRL